MSIWAPWSCKELLTTGSKSWGHAVSGRGPKNKESAVEWSGRDVPACGLQSLCWLPHPLIDSSIDPSILPFTHTSIHSPSNLSITHPSFYSVTNLPSRHPPTHPHVHPSVRLSTYLPHTQNLTLLWLRGISTKQESGAVIPRRLQPKAPWSVVFNMAWSSSLLKSHTGLRLRNFRWLRVSRLLSLVQQLPK